MTEQEIVALIQSSTATLKILLPLLTKSNLGPEILNLISAAIDNLVKVTGTDVTYGQLESLRIKPPDWSVTSGPKTP